MQSFKLDRTPFQVSSAMTPLVPVKPTMTNHQQTHVFEETKWTDRQRTEKCSCSSKKGYFCRPTVFGRCLRVFGYGVTRCRYADLTYLISW